MWERERLTSRLRTDNVHTICQTTPLILGIVFVTICTGKCQVLRSWQQKSGQIHGLVYLFFHRICADMSHCISKFRLIFILAQCSRSQCWGCSSLAPFGWMEESAALRGLITPQTQSVTPPGRCGSHFTNSVPYAVLILGCFHSESLATTEAVFQMLYLFFFYTLWCVLQLPFESARCHLQETQSCSKVQYFSASQTLTLVFLQASCAVACSTLEI